jgi:hypothetical protein
VRPVVLTVQPQDRATVLEALHQRAMELDGEAMTRRKDSPARANLIQRATRLRPLADQLRR